MSEATEIHTAETQGTEPDSEDKYVILRDTGDGNYALVTSGIERKDALRSLKDEPHGSYLLFRYLGPFEVGPPKRSSVSVVRSG